MSEMKLNGVEMVDGTSESFDLSKLNDITKMYFIRTDKDGKEGYIYFNGKKYGELKYLNAGEY